MSCSCQQNTTGIHYICSQPSCPACNCCQASCSCGSDSAVSTDSSDITYSGPNLTCLEKDTGSSVEEILQAADARICAISGSDWSAFNTQCILNEDDSHPGNAQETIEAICDYLCNLQVTYNTFVSNYNTYVTEVTEQITTASTAGITTTCTGIIPADTNDVYLQKLDTAICSLQSETSVSGVNWNVCGLTTVSAPATIPAAFTKVLEYICTVYNAIPSAVSIPTFNNVGSCLPGTLTSTDTLASTVDKIKTKLCSLSLTDPTTLTYGCVSSATTNQQLAQNIINRVNDFTKYTFNPTYFTLSLIDSGNTCLGYNVTLNTSGMDKYVGSNSSDTTPGYLINKLQAGTNITLDDITTPGKVIINSTGTPDTYKVKVNSSDSSPDYLDTKVDGTSDSTSSLSIAATANGSNDKVIITPTFDFDNLSDSILDAIAANSTLMSKFCAMACSCGCTNPTVQFIVYSEPGSTQSFTADQNSPTLSMYNTGSVTISSVSSISSGIYMLTTGAPNPQLTLNFTNTGVSAIPALSIYVKDLSGNPVPGSSSVSSPTIAPGGVYSNSAFQLGTGVSAYVVHVDIT